MYVAISHAYAHSSALYEETTVLESSKDSFLRYMYWKCCNAYRLKGNFPIGSISLSSSMI